MEVVVEQEEEQENQAGKGDNPRGKEGKVDMKRFD